MRVRLADFKGTVFAFKAHEGRVVQPKQNAQSELWLLSYPCWKVCHRKVIRLLNLLKYSVEYRSVEHCGVEYHGD